MGWVLGLFLDVSGRHPARAACSGPGVGGLRRPPLSSPGAGAAHLAAEVSASSAWYSLYQVLILWITGIQGMPVLASAYWSFAAGKYAAVAMGLHRAARRAPPLSGRLACSHALMRTRMPAAGCRMP